MKHHGVGKKYAHTRAARKHRTGSLSFMTGNSTSGCGRRRRTVARVPRARNAKNRVHEDFNIDRAKQKRVKCAVDGTHPAAGPPEVEVQESEILVHGCEVVDVELPANRAELRLKLDVIDVSLHCHGRRGGHVSVMRERGGVVAGSGVEARANNNAIIGALRFASKLFSLVLATQKRNGVRGRILQGCSVPEDMYEFLVANYDGQIGGGGRQPCHPRSAA